MLSDDLINQKNNENDEIFEFIIKELLDLKYKQKNKQHKNES